jgi:CHASE1-domain containing sensor protein
MQKFSWRTMIIFVMVLLLGVILLGLGIAYVGKLKQERRQLSESFGYRAYYSRSRVADFLLASENRSGRLKPNISGRPL